MNAIARLAVVGGVLCAACGAGPPPPAMLDAANDACGYCRMVVSDPRFASQVAAPNEEPRFFDDLGCLKHFLDAGAGPRVVVYVADHRTKAWVVARNAVYTRVDATAPMGSHFIAHASTASRDADPDAATGQPAAVADVLGPGGARDKG